MNMTDVKMKCDKPELDATRLTSSFIEEPKKFESKASNQNGDGKYIDDMTLFMAWHNWYLIEQNRLLSNLVHLHQNHAMFRSSYIHAANNNNTQLRSEFSNGDISVNNATSNNDARRGGFAAKLAPFRKRLAAEFIDFLILLLVKLFVITYCLGEQYIDRFQYVLIIDDNTTIEDLQATLMQALLLRLIAVAYEGYCLSGTLPLSNGSTLGKRIMGLQVVRCDIVEDLDAVQRSIFIIPGGNIGTLRSLIRATMKNAIISLFFPMLLPFHIIANHNRLIYDIATGAIVIEKVEN